MITEDQKKAFGFAGTSLIFTEVLKFLQDTQNALVLQAIAHGISNEDRAHFCGQADGINYVLSSLIELRKQARQLNGLTPEEDLA